MVATVRPRQVGERIVDPEEDRRISQARAGDSEAIEWLLDRYRDRVVRLAAHVLRRPGEAEDVAQEAFVKAFRNLDAYSGDGSFYSWLYRIVVRNCIERQRRFWWSKEQSIEAVSLAYEPDESALTAAENRLLAESLLDRLKPPMRAMLVLRELEGLEYTEIAQILQIPVGRVKWRLHAARAQFELLVSETTKETHHV